MGCNNWGLHPLARTRACALRPALCAGDVHGAETLCAELAPTNVPSQELLALLDLLTGKGADLRALNQAILIAYLPPMVTGWPLDNGYFEKLMARGNAAFFDQKLLHQLDATLFHAGQYARALHVAKESFETYQDPTDAYNAACSLCQLGNETEALEWLQRSVAAGFHDLELLRSDADIASLRNSATFAGILDEASRVKTLAQ